MTNEKRLIDGNALRNEIAEENPYVHIGPFGYCACSPKTDAELVFKREDVLRAIDSAPTVDAVEVVRCKNCLHYEETIGNDSGKPCGYGRCANRCVNITWIVYDDDFCSYGERKEVNESNT